MAYAARSAGRSTRACLDIRLRGFSRLRRFWYAKIGIESASIIRIRERKPSVFLIPAHRVTRERIVKFWSSRSHKARDVVVTDIFVNDPDEQRSEPEPSIANVHLSSHFSRL